MNPPNSIFKLGKNWKITTDTLMGTDIIIIDNYYHYPEAVKSFCSIPFPQLWRAETPGSPNGCFYQDRRLQRGLATDDVLQRNKEILGLLCGQQPVDCERDIVTNMSKFYKHSFNDIDNCYWWPHTDFGYNAVVFLNDEIEGEYSGTAIYHPDDLRPEEQMQKEGLNPWVPKSQYRLVKHVAGKYNRCVLFDGKKFPHAMHINDYTFFDNFYRINHVHFFTPYD